MARYNCFGDCGDFVNDSLPRVVHVLPHSNISNLFIDRVPSDLPWMRHEFVVTGSPSAVFTRPVGPQVQFIEATSRARKLNWPLRADVQMRFSAADHIVVHGMFSASLPPVLLARPNVLKKTYWVVWGADLHEWKSRLSTTARAQAALRRLVAARCAGVATLTDGDAVDMTRFARIPLTMHRVTYYNPLADAVLRAARYPLPTSIGPTRILVGNSPAPSNRHQEIFELLRRFRDEDIEILTPLSYGRKDDYADSVARKGRTSFGDKFVPLWDFQEPEEYVRTLQAVSVGVFGHHRQQGLGTISALCGLGKKVYIDPGNSVYGALASRFRVERLGSLAGESFSEFQSFPACQAEANRAAYVDSRSRAERPRQWASLLGY